MFKWQGPSDSEVNLGQTWLRNGEILVFTIVAPDIGQNFGKKITSIDKINRARMWRQYAIESKQNAEIVFNR